MIGDGDLAGGKGGGEERGKRGDRERDAISAVGWRQMKVKVNPIISFRK